MNEIYNPFYKVQKSIKKRNFYSFGYNGQNLLLSTLYRSCTLAYESVRNDPVCVSKYNDYFSSKNDDAATFLMKQKKLIIKNPCFFMNSYIILELLVLEHLKPLQINLI